MAESNLHHLTGHRPALPPLLDLAAASRMAALFISNHCEPSPDLIQSPSGLVGVSDSAARHGSLRRPCATSFYGAVLSLDAVPPCGD
jgi:hypothetical protein